MLVLGLLCWAAPLHGQSLQSVIMDDHWVHLATKPVVTGMVYAGARLVKLSPNVATGVSVVAPMVVATVRLETLYPGAWNQPDSWRDRLADGWASLIAPILIRTRGWARVVLASCWGIMEFGYLHHFSRP